MKMAKKTSTTSDKSLSEDLLEFCVLPRLPAKSLIRFKCVSKNWHHIISAPSAEFIRKQSQHAPSSLIFDSFIISRHTCIFKDPMCVSIPSFTHLLCTIIASCNGLCALWFMNKEMFGKVLIGNPSLKYWKELLDPWPHCEPRPKFCGLAVDVKESVQYEFVIAREILYGGDIEYQFHIFSSNSGRWNVAGKIKSPGGHHPLTPKPGSTVYLMGNLYWTCLPTHGNVHALRFSLEEGLGSLQLLPPGADGDGMIGEYGGKLSYTMCKEGEIQMWSMNDSIWSKRLSIYLENTMDRKLKSLAPGNHTLQSRPKKPYTAANKVMMLPFEGGVHLSFRVERTIYLYDTVTGDIHKQPYETDSERCFSYKNTLVPLN